MYDLHIFLRDPPFFFFYTYLSTRVCLCAGEAEDLSSRLQASKHRVSELERTLSTVSTQQKQFEKVADPPFIFIISYVWIKDKVKFKKPLFPQHNKELEKERDSLRLEVLRFK